MCLGDSSSVLLLDALSVALKAEWGAAVVQYGEPMKAFCCSAGSLFFRV